MAEVETFGNHLRTDENAAFLLFEVRNDLFVSLAVAGCIEIHTGNGIVGKSMLYLFFDAFCPETVYDDARFAASGTTGRYFLRVSAVMAYETVGAFMVSQTYIALGTTRCPCA